jgi:hypothetical protein
MDEKVGNRRVGHVVRGGRAVEENGHRIHRPRVSSGMGGRDEDGVAGVVVGDESVVKPNEKVVHSKTEETVKDNNLYQASSQWASRPDDQRFLTLEDLKASVSQRKAECWTVSTVPEKLTVQADEENGKVLVRTFDNSIGDNREVEPTHWGFGQLAAYAGAPAGYLRKLPATLAAINLQYGLEKITDRENVLVLGRSNGDQTLRALTSTSYGRIWDKQVVEAVERVNVDGRWKVPSATYSKTDPKRATTLYASDRDVFIFLVDPENEIEVGGEKLYRGFITWNSEVGSAVFGLTTFLYRVVCDNRIIWGATDVKELRIRHTGGAPERFAYEGADYLHRYAEEATVNVVETIKKAQRFELPEAEKKGSGWDKWLQSRGFTASVAKKAIESAKAEEGSARSLWDIINGVTAYARGISYTDERVAVETAAGNLLNVLK